MNLLKYQKDIHDTNVKSGFWEHGTDRNKGEMVALICSELYEAVEGHRKGLRVNIDSLDRDFLNNMTSTIQWKAAFKSRIKDTVEDEIADAVIRLLDFCGGFEYQIPSRDYRKDSTGNFANDILRINHYIIEAFHGGIATGKDWGYALAAIIKLCEWYNIDLEQHIQWKMKFNSTRPYKHQKAY